VLYSMSGPGGKASWALRGELTVNRSASGQAIADTGNMFEDWRRNSSGPARNTVAQALESDAGLHYFQDNLKRESGRFKNFWLNDEVGADDMFEDRTRFCDTGVKIGNKTLQAHPPNHAFKATLMDRDERFHELFHEYNLKPPRPVVLKKKGFDNTPRGRADASAASPTGKKPVEVLGFAQSPPPFFSWPPLKNLEALLNASHERLDPKEKPGSPKGKKKKDKRATQNAQA